MAQAEPARNIPEGLAPYKSTPEFTEATVPEGLQRLHSTKEGVWGRICVLEGTLLYRILDDRRRPRHWLLTPGVPGVVEPTIVHHIEASGPVRFRVDFYR